ncbi:hypothetical protein C8R48DRAFT_780320 [Suillus tomentosus]|nr:hypothetical protein C8R48DRAFT_780320 [Suillus tomentosus]
MLHVHATPQEACVILSFDPVPSTGSPTLNLLARTIVGHHPSWIASHPFDKSLICTGLEQADGKVAAIKYGRGGTVEEGEVVVQTLAAFLLQRTSLSLEMQVPKTSALPILMFPFLHPRLHPVLLGHNRDPPDINIRPLHTLTTPMDTFDAVRKELLVPDLGTDKVWRLTKRNDGKRSIRDHIDFEAGGGPRHIAARGNTLCTLLELTSKLAVHTFPPLPVPPTRLTSVHTFCITDTGYHVGSGNSATRTQRILP